jgi:hypothetical protein
LALGFVVVVEAKNFSENQNTALMTRLEYTRGLKKESMVFIEREKMNATAVDKWWDRIRIVCHQPFR